MKIEPEHIRSLAQLSGLNVPEEDFLDISLRLSAMLTALEEFETEMASQIDAFEPVPPVYASEKSLAEFFNS